MAQEELKKELIKAAENGKQEYFNEICEQLEKTTENRMLIHFYSGILINHPKVIHKVFK